MTPVSGAPRPRRRRLLGPLLLAVRRVHLYLGLALLPWALLYGVTAVLFNHPLLFSGATERRLEGAAPPFPAADALAREVAAELGQADARRVRLLDLEAPRFEHALAWRIARPEEERRVLVVPGRDEVTLRVIPRAPRPTDPSAGLGPLRAGREALEAATAAVVSLAAPGAAPGDVRPVVPALVLALEVDGVACLARYDARTGKLEAHALDDAPTLGWRALVTRLHLTHGYPAEGGWARVAWALVVDLMGVALLVWASTGLVMWIPMRGLRRSGLLALTAGASWAIVLTWALAALLRR